MKKNLFSLLLFFICTTLHAQWDGDPATASTKFCTSLSDDISKFLISDGTNGAILVSQSINYSTFSSEITAQRINADGVLQWGDADAPKLVYSNSSFTEFSNLYGGIDDGSGGAYIAWVNYLDTFSNIYLQHINSSGDNLWAATGIKINHDNDRTTNSINFCKDGSGGVVVVWDESIYDSSVNKTTYSQCFAQRYNSAGAKQWGANGIQVCTVPGLRAAASITNDGTNNFICCFADTRNSAQLPEDIFNNIDIYAQKITINGALSWASAGLPVTTAALNQVPSGTFSGFSSTISDAAGGVIVLYDQYADDKQDTLDHLYAQRIDGTGTKQWTSSGVPVCVSDSTRFVLKTVSDGAGGMVAAWDDQRASSPGIYSQKILSNGTTGWTTNGINIMLNGGSGPGYSNIDITDDGIGNYIFTSDYNNEIRAQKFNSSGVAQWGIGGKPVCTNSSASPYSPNIVKSNSGNAIIDWFDVRTGFLTNTDVFAAKIGADGTLIGATSYYITTTNGNWNVGSTWIGGVVPPANADVIVRHDVKVTANASCNSLRVEQPTGKLTVNTGFKLTVLQ